MLPLLILDGSENCLIRPETIAHIRDDIICIGQEVNVVHQNEAKHVNLLQFSLYRSADMESR
jgi:hypothetical protein